MKKRCKSMLAIAMQDEGHIFLNPTNKFYEVLERFNNIRLALLTHQEFYSVGFRFPVFHDMPVTVTGNDAVQVFDDNIIYGVEGWPGYSSPAIFEIDVKGNIWITLGRDVSLPVHISKMI